MIAPDKVTQRTAESGLGHLEQDFWRNRPGGERVGHPKALCPNNLPIADKGDGQSGYRFPAHILRDIALEIGNDGFATTEQAVKAAIASDAPVIVICSTDKTYPELVPPLAKGIKEGKPDAIVLVAGYPSEHIEAFKEAGVDDFIHIRANCYELLNKLQQHIGVAK